MFRKTTSVLLLSTSLFLVGCSDSDDNNTSDTLGQSLGDRGYPTLQAAIDAAGLSDTLTNGGPFTVLAPSEAAFAALPAGTLDFLLNPANQSTLRDILLYHVIDGEADSSVVSSLSSATTLNGANLIIDSVGSNLLVNEAVVGAADIVASNGIIHQLDTVLMPPGTIVDTLVSRGFSTLVTAVTAADLVTTLSGPGPFTVLAPTDAAFANLPAGVLDDLLLPANMAQLVDILTYHVTSGAVRASDAVAAETPKALNDVTLLFAANGGAATVNEVSISMVNIPCTNGVIHVLDAVLLPAEDIPTVATDGGFDTLVAALTAAELVDDLQAAGPFTVFAPSEAAFAALPAGTLDTLLLPANQQMLIDLLLYHVVADELTAAEVLGQTNLVTLEGSDLPVDSSLITVGGATISATNILARNGIIHVVDDVLMPPGLLLALPGDTPEQASLEVFAPDTLYVQAPIGQGTEPLWFGDPRSQDIRFEDFRNSNGQPFLPTSGSGTVLLGTGMGATNLDGALQADLSGTWRLSMAWENIPQAGQLDLRTAGNFSGQPELVLALSDGQVRRFPLTVETPGSLFTWQLASVGLPIESADIEIPMKTQGTTLEALRLHVLQP